MKELSIWKFIKDFWLDIVAGIILINLSLKVFLVVAIFYLLYHMYRQANLLLASNRIWFLSNKLRILTICSKLKLTAEDYEMELNKFKQILSAEEISALSEDIFEFLKKPIIPDDFELDLELEDER